MQIKTFVEDMVHFSSFWAAGLTLFGAVLVFSSLTGCLESEKKSAVQEQFVPATVQPRVERHCNLIRLNGEMGDMAAIDYQKLDKELVPPFVERYRLLHVPEKKAKDKEDGDLANASAAESTSVSPESPTDITANPCMPQEVIDAIRKANIRNYSLFFTKMNKVYYAIRYFDYVGQNFEVDWMNLERNPVFTQWRNACEECQLPLPTDKTEGSSITMLWELNAEEVFYQE